MGNQLTTTSKQELSTISNNGLAIYSPRELAKSYRHVTLPVQAACSGEKSLALLTKELGEKKITALLKLHLIDLNEKLNAKRPLTEAMIVEIAEEIISLFPLLNFADVNLILRNAKTGVYGEMYDCINEAKVLGWFRSYFNERCDACGELSRRENQNQKTNLFDRSSSGKTLHQLYNDEQYKEFKNKIKIK